MRARMRAETGSAGSLPAAGSRVAAPTGMAPAVLIAFISISPGDTKALFGLRRVTRFANIERPALRKLKQLELARRIDDLRAPPANRPEQLKGERAGQWSMRVNDQFRICFRWTGTGAEDVEIVDYH